MLEILEAGNDAPIEAPRGAGSKGKTSCPPGQMCGKYKISVNIHFFQKTSVVTFSENISFSTLKNDDFISLCFQTNQTDFHPKFVDSYQSNYFRF